MEKFTFFWAGPFSQWHKSKMVIDGINFSTAEQYMMYSKAMLFGDTEIAEKILKTSNPKDQKALGRLVKNFDNKIWQKNCREIVYKGNYAKFTQDVTLKRQLLATAGTTLVEASPYDRIWGVGLAADDPRINDRSKWLGTNLLGEILTELRENLINNK